MVEFGANAWGKLLKPILSLLFVLAGLAAAMPAVEASEPCVFCNASVRFDEALATCFEQNWQIEVDKLKTAKVPVAVINLAACGDEIRTRSGGLPTGSSSAGILDSTFMLMEDSLTCLADAVAKRNKPLPVAQLFVIAEVCP
jgi:hypothetical protein